MNSEHAGDGLDGGFVNRSSNSQVTGTLSGIDAHEVRDQLERVLASPLFSGSESLSRLLRYCVEMKLTGLASEVKEVRIGREVFGRGEAFDPRIDPIVRVQASKARFRLRLYFEGEGRQDGILVEIPRGTYVPSFRRRTLAEKLTGAATGPGEKTSVSNGSARLSIAVLPLNSLSPDRENDVFCDGLTDELMHALSALTGVSVVSRTSVFQFKGRHEDVRNIAAALNADLVLEGSVRHTERRIRVAVQISSSQTGYHIWSETLDRDLGDPLSVQTDLALAIGAKVGQLLRGLYPALFRLEAGAGEPDVLTELRPSSGQAASGSGQPGDSSLSGPPGEPPSAKPAGNGSDSPWSEFRHPLAWGVAVGGAPVLQEKLRPSPARSAGAGA